MKKLCLLGGFLLVSWATSALAEVVVRAKDGRVFRVPLQASEIAAIEFAGQSVGTLVRPQEPPRVAVNANLLSGKWDFVWDRKTSGLIVPEEAPYPVQVTVTGNQQFTARYVSGLYGSYAGQLVFEGGRTLVRMDYSDPARSYTARFEGTLLDDNTIEGRYSDSRGDNFRYRWIRSR